LHAISGLLCWMKEEHALIYNNPLSPQTNERA
jgi:hypothetical protein